MKGESSTRGLAKTAMMAALVFIGTYLVKIPMPNGYAHLGDCMIFLGVLLLGKKRGALAGGIGGAFSDLLAGYMHWVFPTFFIKYIMAFTMGLFVEKILPNRKWNWLPGTVLGGMVQCVLYLAVDAALFGIAYGIADLPVNLLQSAAGVLLTGVLTALLKKSGMLERLKEI